jgi:tetratricopeptide (TPR) repeat protein
MRWGIALLALVGTAAADPTVRDDDKLEADRLFQEGRDLLTAGKRAEACAKFDLSIRKDPRAVGTILNLGLCAEEAGQVATAVRYYTEARARAKDQELVEHQQAAESKLALLAPRVPHLAIQLPAGAPLDTRVIVDSQVLAQDQLTDVPVDPGDHTITVTARDKLPYETKVSVTEAEHKTLTVPALQGARTLVVQSSSRRLWGKILVGSGVALGGAGVALGLYGRSLYWEQFPADSRDGKDAQDAQHHCFTYNDTRHCDPLGASKVGTARKVASAGTIVGIVGVLAAGVGGYLWWTAPDSVSIEVDHDRAAVAFTVRW